jgi:hypothetical protein
LRVERYDPVREVMPCRRIGRRPWSATTPPAESVTPDRGYAAYFTRCRSRSPWWPDRCSWLVGHMCWLNAPELVIGGIYLGLGWLAVPALPALLHHIAPAGLVLIVAGGVLYTLGALGSPPLAQPGAGGLRLPRGLPHLRQRRRRVPLPRDRDLRPLTAGHAHGRLRQSPPLVHQHCPDRCRRRPVHSGIDETRFTTLCDCLGGLSASARRQRVPRYTAVGLPGAPTRSRQAQRRR